MTAPYIWGHNPGAAHVKDSITGPTGKHTDHPTYPAVLAPWAESDDLGVSARARPLEATVDGARYIGGRHAARLPNAIRQMASGRLQPESPMYRAFAQMSVQHTKLPRGSAAYVATALPVAWRTPEADQLLEQQIRDGLRGLVEVRAVYVKSEPAAVVLAELLDDMGQINRANRDLARGIIAVADIGGSTLNRSVLESDLANGVIEPLAGQAASPLMGTQNVIRELAERLGISLVDAEQMLHDGVPEARAILRQWHESVVAELQMAWRTFRPTAILLAGGGSLMAKDALLRAFPTAHLTASPQFTIAHGLRRYAMRQYQRNLKK